MELELPFRPAGTMDAVVLPARESADGYVPYEDIQRNLESMASEVSVPDPDSPTLLSKRADSLPQLPSETTQAMKAGDIAQLGGFRREHLHRNGRTDIRQTLMSSSDDSVVAGLSRRESGQLVSCDFNFMKSAHQSDRSWSDGGVLS